MIYDLSYFISWIFYRNTEVRNVYYVTGRLTQVGFPWVIIRWHVVARTVNEPKWDQIRFFIINNQEQKILRTLSGSHIKIIIPVQQWEPLFSQLISHCFTCSQNEHDTDPLNESRLGSFGCRRYCIRLFHSFTEPVPLTGLCPLPSRVKKEPSLTSNSSAIVRGLLISAKRGHGPAGSISPDSSPEK